MYGDIEMKQLSNACLVFLIISIVVTSWQIPQVKPQESDTHGSFGSTFTPQPLNWSKFWRVFNQHSAWDLEYNNGSGWISDKSMLQVIKNYSKPSYEGRQYNLNKSDASACKITLNFTASYTADYRLTFGIDLDVKNYTHKEGSWNYTLSYKNHTVFFDWTDIKGLPLDSVNHGIQPIGEESWFWFRIRKNNVQQGKNVVIDPSFGNENEEATDHDCGNYCSTSLFTFIESESGTYTADSISVFYDVDEINNNCSFGMYFSNDTLIQYTEQNVNSTVQDDTWITLNFLDPPPVLTNNTAYKLAFWQSDVDGGTDAYEFHRQTTGGTHQYRNLIYDFPNWIDPYVQSGGLNFLVSIYCNYTVAGAGETYVVDVSQALSTSWTMLTEWNAITGLSQSITSSWTCLIQSNFNVLPSISNTFTWIVDVIHTVGATTHIVDLTQALSTTWTSITQWNSIVDLSQSLTTSWTVLIQSTFNIIPSLSNSFTWLVDVVKGVSVSHIVDLTFTIATTWLSSAFHTPWTEIYATKGFVLATFLIVIFIIAPAIVIVWRRE